MTFTEAAVEVLRLVGRPLHYKKITEIAIAKNLLSHVGKAPDMTMSSRLATMIKKDRGEEPIIKVKPGVFGLREFSDEVLALADADYEVDPSTLPDLPPAATAESEEAEEEEAPRVRPMMPGADVFPEEEDDDEPILAKLDTPAAAPAAEGGERGGEGERRGRRRRRRGRGRGGENGEPVREMEPREQQRPQREPERERDRDRDRHRERDRDRDRDRDRPRERAPERERLDMTRVPEEGDVMGQDLADAVFAALEGQRPEPLSFTRVADLLIRKGRLQGSAAALAPTVAAAVRADGLRRGGQGARFRLVDGRLALAEWYLPGDASRIERDVRRAAGNHRDVVYRAFLRKLGDLPTAGFAELMATWLNAEGVSSLRAVRRPGSSGVELHLAGAMHRGQEEVRVAILILRDGRDLRGERIVEMRGALHHYGNASLAWVVTTSRVEGPARSEVEVAGAPPVMLFDGRALAQAMEARGVGLRVRTVPMSSIDLDLLDALRGQPEPLEEDRGRDRGGERDRDREREREDEDEESRGRRKRRRKRRGRDREREPAAPGEAPTELEEELEEGEEEEELEGSEELEGGEELEEEGDELEGEPEGEEGEEEPAAAAEGTAEEPRRRRRRRGGRRRRRGGQEPGAEAAAPAEPSDEQAFEGAEEPEGDVEEEDEEDEEPEEEATFDSDTQRFEDAQERFTDEDDEDEDLDEEEASFAEDEDDDESDIEPDESTAE